MSSYTNHLAEEILWNDGIQLLEAPVLFPSPRPLFVASVGPFAMDRFFFKAPGTANEVDGIAVLFPICNSHIPQQLFEIDWLPIEVTSY